MEAFKVSTHLSGLLDSYPDANHLMTAATNGGELSKIAIARLWLSEGIPYAFKKSPALYESVRSWLGVHLNVDPKEISITGSGRIGQSLAPNKRGTSFSDKSDLDFFIVSERLFERMRKDFSEWAYQFESGLVHPSNNREKGFWKDNLERGPKNMHRGFLDSHLVPNHKAYPTIQTIAQTMWMLKEKLGITEKAPKVKSVSIRCYKSWEAYVKQMVISLG